MGDSQVRISGQTFPDDAHRTALRRIASHLWINLRAHLRSPGLAGSVAGGTWDENHLCRSWHHPGHDLCYIALRGAHTYSAHASPGYRGGTGSAGARRQRLADVLASDAPEREVGLAIWRGAV